MACFQDFSQHCIAISDVLHRVALQHNLLLVVWCAKLCKVVSNENFSGERSPQATFVSGFCQCERLASPCQNLAKTNVSAEEYSQTENSGPCKMQTFSQTHVVFTERKTDNCMKGQTKEWIGHYDQRIKDDEQSEERDKDSNEKTSLQWAADKDVCLSHNLCHGNTKAIPPTHPCNVESQSPKCTFGLGVTLGGMEVIWEESHGCGVSFGQPASKHESQKSIFTIF